LKLLLDTHLLIRAAEDIRQVPKAARNLMADPDNELLFSPASLWEIAIKSTLGKKDFQLDPRTLHRGLLDNGYLELAITSQHTIAVVALPSHHKDPFDRLLIAQAIVEGITLLTSDPQVARYPGSIRKI
jgi:PIN domain nuclease of toxin-antitoxin system